MGLVPSFQPADEQLRASLVLDRLSQPTADMVDALLPLRLMASGRPAALRAALADAAERGPGRAQVLRNLAHCYCQFLGARPADAWEWLLEQVATPEPFLNTLCDIRAQDLPSGGLVHILREPALHTGAFGEEVPKHLAEFLRAILQCAEAYAEIRTSVRSGQLSPQQAEHCLAGSESDQRRMMAAMEFAMQTTDHADEELCVEMYPLVGGAPMLGRTLLAT